MASTGRLVTQLLVSPNILLAGRTLPLAVRAASDAGDTPALARALAGVHSWRRRAAFKVDEAAAAAAVRRALPSFTVRDFSAVARRKYTAFIAAATARDEAALKPLLSPAALASVRAGWAAGGTAGGGALAVSDWDEAGTGIVASAAAAAPQAAGAAAFMADAPADFVQISFRAVARLEPTARGARSGGGGAAEPPRRARVAPGAAPPAWAAVDDAATGCLYYWDRTTGRTAWQPPRASDFVAAGAHLPFAAPALARDVAGRATHLVTFERCTRDGQRSADWYICAV